MPGYKTSAPPSRLLQRSAYILTAVILTAATAAIEIVTERSHDARVEDELRASLTTQLGTLRAQLEGAVSANAQLVRGMVASIAIDPDISEERFAALGSQLFETRSQLRNIGAGPDLVIRFVYPLEGNEAAIGLDYRKTPEQREAAERARDTGEIVLAGPVNLVQGGKDL